MINEHIYKNRSHKFVEQKTMPKHRQTSANLVSLNESIKSIVLCSRARMTTQENVFVFVWNFLILRITGIVNGTALPMHGKYDNKRKRRETTAEE